MAPILYGESTPRSPALTPDGKAVGLQGGEALFFPHDKALSPSHHAKCSAKEGVRLLRALQVAHSACEAEARVVDTDACSIDTNGIVYGASAMTPPASPELKFSETLRLKRFHHKRHLHQQDNMEKSTFQRTCNIDSDGVVHAGERLGHPFVLDPSDDEDHDPDVHPGVSQGLFDQKSYMRSIDCDGVMHVMEMNPPSPFMASKADRLKRFHHKRTMRSGVHGSWMPTYVICVDNNGTVQTAACHFKLFAAHNSLGFNLYREPKFYLTAD